MLFIRIVMWLKNFIWVGVGMTTTDGDTVEFNLDLSDENTKEFVFWEVWYYLIRVDVQVGQSDSH
jgi:hypothetical protein